MCKAMSNGNESRSALKTARTTMSAFIDSNYSDIAKEVCKKAREYNVPKTELFVEVDFYGDAPALRNEFKVWLASCFLEGSSIANAPNWFRIHSKRKTLALFLRKEHEKVTGDDFLAVCRAGNGIVSAVRLNFPAT
jgi:hypothetical protein